MITNSLPLGQLLAERGYIRGPFGSALRRQELLESGMPVYEQQQAISGTRDFRYFIGPEKQRELERFLVQPGDLIVSCSGTVGKISIIQPEDPKGIISQALLILRPDPEKLESRFLYYFLISDRGQASLTNASHGSVQVNIAPRAMVERIEIPLPPLEEQRRIAHILGTLDDKIELNRQMNKTLDEIARTLFRSWFVDFDPVRAKMEGRQPEGMDVATAALFPDRLVDSELGPIPEGWDVKPFTDLVQVIGGGTPKTSIREYWDGGIPWFAMADIPNDGTPYVLKTTKSITEAGEGNSSAKRIQEGVTILTARGTVGEVVLAGVEMSFNQSCYALAPMASSIGPIGVHLLTRSMVNLIRTRTHGSVFPTITRSTLGSLNIADPGNLIWQRFEDVANDLFALMKSNGLESQELSELRDLLLPQLINGAETQTRI